MLVPTQYNQRFDFAGVELTINGGEKIHRVNISYDSITGVVRAGDLHGQAIGELQVKADSDGRRPIEWDLDGKGLTATGENGDEWFMYRRGCNCGG